MNMKTKHVLFCSFCEKSEGEVSKLITGKRRALICNECIYDAKEIVDENESLSKFKSFFRPITSLTKFNKFMGG